MGANADFSEGVRFCLDWIRVTFRPGELWSPSESPDINVILQALLLPSGYELRDRGRFNYHFGASVVGGYGVLLWGGNNDTLCLDLPASALAYIQEVAGPDVVFSFLEVVDYFKGKITRVDIAFDDFRQDCLDPFVMDSAWSAGLVRTCARKGGLDPSQRFKGESFTGDRRQGWTFKVGTRDSSAYLRIYNKWAEQFDALGASAPSLPDSPWVRVELEIKGDRAPSFFSAWLAAGFSSEFAASYLRGVVDFVDDASADHRDSWPVSSWWLEFLGHCGRVRVFISAGVRVLQDVVQWLGYAAGPSLALVAAAVDDFDGFIGLLRSIVADGAERAGLRHYGVLEASGFGDKIPLLRCPKLSAALGGL